MTRLRKHQLEMLHTINEIIDGALIKKILVYAVPGSGKSAIPLIAGKLISHGKADKICWICPRTALQDQGERNFLDLGFRSLLGHQLTIRSSTNDIDPCRGLDGFITTYQALSVSKNSAVLEDFKARRYILIIDENHHAEVDSLWHKVLKPLVDHAKYLILMTGTLQRGDKQPIAWVKYNRSKPVLEPNNETAVIRYGREIALSEKAILPLEFTLADGHVEWETKNGDHKSGLLSERTSDAGQALFTALSTEFSNTLLDKGVQHWQGYKARRPSSKLLIVTADFDHAKKITAKLKGQSLYAKIATSHDSPIAQKNIKEFKFGRLDILVSIQMVYEGLDVPQITHIVCLTRIRSRPWIEQCIARAVRIDPQAGPYESQQAYIFAPDDFLFRRVVDQIKSDQLAVIAEAQDGERGERNGNGNGTEKEPDIIPLGSMLTGERTFSIGGVWSGLGYGAIPETPSDIEQGLRKQIEAHVKDFCFANYYKIERINAEIKDAFGKPRSAMSLSELRSVIIFIRNAYPLNGSKSIIPQVSQPRGRGRRKSSKVEKVEPPKQLGFFGGGL